MGNVVQLEREKRPLVAHLDYVIVPGKGGRNFAASDLHDQAYSYWKKTWAEVYGSAGAADCLHYDDFSRQDFITLILSKGGIAGMHLYSLFRLDQLATQDLHYLTMFPEGFCQQMIERDVNYVMSLEYLTVDPSWRRSVCGFSLAETLIGCGLQFFNSVNTDAVIAMARTDVKVHDMGTPFGFDCLKNGISKRNFPVACMVGFKDKVHPHIDPRISTLVEDLWSRRTDFTGLTQAPRENNVKKAA